MSSTQPAARHPARPSSSLRWMSLLAALLILPAHPALAQMAPTPAPTPASAPAVPAPPSPEAPDPRTAAPGEYATLIFRASGQGDYDMTVDGQGQSLSSSQWSHRKPPGRCLRRQALSDLFYFVYRFYRHVLAAYWAPPRHFARHRALSRHVALATYAAGAPGWWLETVCGGCGAAGGTDRAVAGSTAA